MNAPNKAYGPIPDQAPGNRHGISDFDLVNTSPSATVLLA